MYSCNMSLSFINNKLPFGHNPYLVKSAWEKCEASVYEFLWIAAPLKSIVWGWYWVVRKRGREERLREILYQEVQSAGRSSTALPGLHSNEHTCRKLKKKSCPTCLATAGMEKRKTRTQTHLSFFIWLILRASFCWIQTERKQLNMDNNN